MATMFERTITVGQAADAGLLDAEWASDHGVLEVGVTLGAVDAASRHLDGIGPSVVVYPRTATGTLGSGAHPGFVAEVEESVALGLGFSEDAILLASGARRCEVRDRNGDPCCADCQAAIGGRRHRLVSKRAQRRVCPSCAVMIRETWVEERQRDVAARAALAAEAA